MMEQATNTFTKGLLTDIHPMMLTNEVLSDCLNGTVITMNGNEPALLNDMGNVRVEDANLPSGYTPVGMKEYGGVIYVAAFNPVTGKSLIGSFPSPERKKSLDNDLQAEFDFNRFVSDSYYEDLDLYENPESYFLKNDSYLVPLTGSIALHVGDKFVIYSSSELFEMRDLITNWNNVHEEYLYVNNKWILTKGIAYSPKNREYTIQVGILNEQNEFIDITKSLVRWDGNDRISDFINDSDIYKFNKGYHIAIEDKDEWQDKIITDDDRQFILNRQASPINNFSYKLAGPLYLKVSYNHVQSFNYDIEGQVNDNTIEITIKGYFTYNCPDKINKNKEYIFKTFKEKVTFGDNDNNPNHWDALKSDGYTGPGGDEWYLYKDYRNKTLLNYTYVSSREKDVEGNWGKFSIPQLIESKYFVTSNDYYTYDLAYEIDKELINYDVEFKLYHNNGNSYEDTSELKSSVYSNIEYNPITNLYSCELEKKYTLTYQLKNLIQDKLEYKIKTYSGLTKTEKENYTIYLKNLCYNGIIDLSLLNSGELTLKQYKFYNKLATKDNEKNLSLLLLRFESYPKEGESRRNLKIEFRNINTSESLTPKRLITDLRITNGVIQLPFTWEQVKEYNSSTLKWINSLLDSRKVYDVKIYYDLYDKDDNLIEADVLYDDIATKAYITYTDFSNLTPAELATYQPYCFKYDTDSISYEMTVIDYTSNPPLLKMITLVGDTWNDKNLVQHTVTEILYWRTERWFLTTELFNDLYSDLSGIDDYCTTTDERITNCTILIPVSSGNWEVSYSEPIITLGNTNYLYSTNNLETSLTISYNAIFNFSNDSTLIEEKKYPSIIGTLIINKSSNVEQEPIIRTYSGQNVQLNTIYYPIDVIDNIINTDHILCATAVGCDDNTTYPYVGSDGSLCYLTIESNDLTINRTIDNKFSASGTNARSNNFDVDRDEAFSWDNILEKEYNDNDGDSTITIDRWNILLDWCKLLKLYNKFLFFTSFAKGFSGSDAQGGCSLAGTLIGTVYNNRIYFTDYYPSSDLLFIKDKYIDNPNIFKVVCTLPEIELLSKTLLYTVLILSTTGFTSMNYGNFNLILDNSILSIESDVKYNTSKLVESLNIYNKANTNLYINLNTGEKLNPNTNLSDAHFLIIAYNYIFPSSDDLPEYVLGNLAYSDDDNGIARIKGYYYGTEVSYFNL